MRRGEREGLGGGEGARGVITAMLRPERERSVPTEIRHSSFTVRYGWRDREMRGGGIAMEVAAVLFWCLGFNIRILLA